MKTAAQIIEDNGREWTAGGPNVPENYSALGGWYRIEFDAWPGSSVFQFCLFDWDTRA